MLTCRTPANIGGPQSPGYHETRAARWHPGAVSNANDRCGLKRNRDATHSPPHPSSGRLFVTVRKTPSKPWAAIFPAAHGYLLCALFFSMPSIPSFELEPTSIAASFSRHTFRIRLAPWIVDSRAFVLGCQLCAVLALIAGAFYHRLPAAFQGCEKLRAHELNPHP